jgi:hypothetical protein
MLKWQLRQILEQLLKIWQHEIDLRKNCGPRTVLFFLTPIVGQIR